MSNRCRIGWFARGRVTRYVPGRPKADTAANEPSASANLKAGPQGMKIVEAEIDGDPWFGRLWPKKPGQNEGIVLLFKSPVGERA